MQILLPTQKRDLLKILPFGIIWLILCLLFLFIEYSTITVYGLRNQPQSVINITPKILAFACTSVFFIGCFVGFLEVKFINKFFVDKSFPTKLLGKTSIYFALMLLIMFVFYQLAASIEMQKSVFDVAIFRRYQLFFFSLTNISTSIQLGFSVFLSLLYSEIRDNLGQNVLLNFFVGKYHRPKVEHRVFMFMDMKNSTSIAEKIGNINYFNFLRSYYNDLSASIVKFNGEVYQYIGDEIVISWQNSKPNAVQNSIDCFFDMQQKLLDKKEKYVKEYQVYPEFKAAIHQGNVTVGEIGALKKEIFFTGDVLNTTARIQGLCNKYLINLLVSEKIARFINSNQYQLKRIENVDLKGKSKTITIFGVQKKTEIH